MCQKYAGNEKVYGKEMGRGECRKFPSKFFVSNCRTIPRGTLYSFISLGYRKKFMLQRVMSQFSVEFFCLRVPNHFVEEPFCAVFHKTSGSENVYGKEDGG